MTRNLTPKQERFCQGVAEGQTYSDAYRTAYACSSASGKTVRTKASLLAKDPRVSERISELKMKLEDRLLYTLEKSFKNLERAQEIALSKGTPEKATPDLTAFLKAEELKGKLTKLYAEKDKDKKDAAGSGAGFDLLDGLSREEVLALARAYADK